MRQCVSLLPNMESCGDGTAKRLVKGRVTCRNQHIQEEQIKELFMQAVTKMKNHPERLRKITVYERKRNIRFYRQQSMK